MLQILTCRADVAAEYGIDAAVFLHNIVYWTLKNQAEGRHCHKGRYWMYASLKALSELYPMWSVAQIRRIPAKLKDGGALLTGYFNEDRTQRTSWYSPSDEILALYGVEGICQNQQMHLPKSAQPFAEIDTCNKDHIETQIDTPYSPPEWEALFERFWAAYPKKKGKEAAKRAWRRLKPDMALCRVMAAALDRQRQSKDWLKEGGAYIPYPATWLNGRRWEDEGDAPPQLPQTAPVRPEGGRYL